MRACFLTTLLGCSGLLRALGPVQAEDWQRFRGPGGSGRSESTGVPVRWSTSDNILWRMALPGPGASSPIGGGERILLTCYSGYGEGADPGDRSKLTLHLLCCDRQSGTLQWNVKHPAADCEREYKSFVGLHGFASGTPVSDGQRVFAFFGCSGVFACSLEGESLWQAGVGTGTHGFGTGTSPLVYEDLVIVNASVESGALVALQGASGEEVWRAGGINQSWSTPVLVPHPDGTSELVVVMKQMIKGLDPRTGEVRWQCEGINDYICPSPVVHEDTLYAIGGRRGECLAIRTGGEGSVTASHKLWQVAVGSNVPSPVYHEGHLYWVNHTGQAYVVEAATGRVVTRLRIPEAGRTYASLTYADGRLYTVTRQNGTFVFTAEPSLPLEAHNVIADDESIFNASPAIVDARVYLRSDKSLYCIGQ